MANTFIYSNNASSTLAAPISSTSTSCTVSTGQGSLFPSPISGQQYSMTFNDAATGLLVEIVYVTARSGDTMTIVRAQEGTVAQSWLAGDLCANLITAAAINSFVQAVEFNPARTITASGAFTINQGTDYAIGFNRTTSLANSAGQLPNNSTVGQIYVFEDLAGNFEAWPVSITPPSGFSICNLPGAATLNVNRGSYSFRYYGDNIYSMSGP